MRMGSKVSVWGHAIAAPGDPPQICKQAPARRLDLISCVPSAVVLVALLDFPVILHLLQLQNYRNKLAW